MLTVKAKDIPHETLALQKRIEFLRELKEVLKDQGTLVGETVKLYSELIDEIVEEVSLEVHRSVVTGVDAIQSDEKCIEAKGMKHKMQDSATGKTVTDSSTQKETVVDPQEAMKEAAIFYGTPNHLGVQMSGSKGAVDMFGNMIQPVALDQVKCPNCNRTIAAGRFAPHLDKCMSGGRQAGRAANARLHDGA